MSKSHATHTYRVVWDGDAGERCQGPTPFTSSRRAGAFARDAVDHGRRNVRIEVASLSATSAGTQPVRRDHGVLAEMAGE